MIKMDGGVQLVITLFVTGFFAGYMCKWIDVELPKIRKVVRGD